MNIRPAVEGEAEALSALAAAAKAQWGYSSKLLGAWRKLLTVTPEEIRGKPTFVAEEGTELVGFYSLWPAGAMWDLKHLWVAPPHMRRGFGRALLSHARETARLGGASEIVVDAEPNAESFYLACGAVRRGVVPAPIPGQAGRVRPQLSLNVMARTSNL